MSLSGLTRLHEGRLGLHHDEQAVRHALVGATSDLAARVWQHRNGTGSEFCKRYGLKRLLYAEEHARIDKAIAREKMIKAWNRNWKMRQIMEMNPDWDDLFERFHH